MKLLLDQDVYAATARFLQGLGHDVVGVGALGLSRAADAELIKLAQELGRVFVARDRDFGRLVFVNRLGPGVLYLRMLPATVQAIHAELERVLESYGEEELRQAFVVVGPGRHRIRRLRGPMG